MLGTIKTTGFSFYILFLAREAWSVLLSSFSSKNIVSSYSGYCSCHVSLSSGFWKHPNPETQSERAKCANPSVERPKSSHVFSTCSTLEKKSVLEAGSPPTPSYKKLPLLKVPVSSALCSGSPILLSESSCFMFKAKSLTDSKYSWLEWSVLPF